MRVSNVNDFSKYISNYDYLVSTDGACKGNPGKGTWAFVVYSPNGNTLIGHKKGSSPNTTNNKMELTAILEALLWASKHSKRLHIKSDSSYCVKGITEWMNSWADKNWCGVKNVDLWQQVYNLWGSGSHKIEKVKGHSGDRHNEAADMYCNEEYMNVFM